VEWFLGYPERAQTMAEAALARAQEADQAFTLAAVLYFGAAVHLLCRNPARGLELAEQGESLSARQGFPFWHAVTSAMVGWALVQRGQPREGNAAIERAVRAMDDIGLKLGSVFFLAFLAEGHLGAGALADGLAAVDTGLELARTTLDRTYEPELWRLKGELLLRAEREGQRKEAERCFRRALSLARASAAKSLELRAAISLARASQARGRTADARGLLGGICKWFGARAGGPDIREARSLLGGVEADRPARGVKRVLHRGAH